MTPPSAPLPVPPARRFHSGGAEFATQERCFMTEIVNHDGCPAFSLALGRVAPGVTTQLHSLDVAETYCVLAGGGMMEIDGESFALDPGDGVHIGPGQSQRIRNTGAEDLRLYLVCRPRFTPACYHNLEDTQ